MNLINPAKNTIHNYLLSKEAVSAYINPSQIKNKRDLYGDLSLILENFLKTDYSEEEIEVLEKLIDQSQLIKKKTEKKNSVNAKLKDINTKGFELLKINDELDLNTLKKLYRKASKRHHPDMGGSDENMKIINNAYTAFYDFLTSHYFISQDHSPKSVESTVASFDSWRFSCCLTLAIMHADVFAVDLALKYLKQASELINIIPAKYASKFIKIIYMSCDITKVVKASGRLKMRNEFNEAIQITTDLIDIMYNFWVKLDPDDNRLQRSFYSNKEELKNEFGVKLVINHIEKAHNAFRLGAINQDRYKRTINKYQDEQKLADNFNKACYEYYSTNEVCNLYDLTFDHAKNKSFHFIGFSETRFCHLSEALQFEYLEIYYSPTAERNYIKFLKIRYHELLLAVFHDYKNIDLITKEVEFYLSHGFKLIDELEQIQKVIIYIETLKPLLRAELFTIIKILDTDKTREWNPYFNLVEDNAHLELKPYLRIEPSPYFFRFIQKDIDDIYFFHVTGMMKR